MTFPTSGKSYALVLAVSLAPLVSAGRAEAVGFEILKPHRAVYEVELEEASERSGIDSMSGRIVYEMTGDECDGVSVNYRFVSRVNANGQIFTTDQQTASYETPDGREYNFLTKSFVDERMDRTVKGKARIASGEMEVKLDSPEQRVVDLPGADFISSHLVKVIDGARNGKHFFSLNVFDGGDDADEVLKTTNVIGSPQIVGEPLPGEEKAALVPLSGEEAWPVTIGYFKTNLTDSTEATPVYEVSFLLYDGGISRKLIMRYPDYSIRGTLVGLEYLEDTSGCQLKN
ncbi:MAG: DUF1849 family protein [Nitratireductor sp.]|nr:DUF1849 family protein [Nitratireductor sp.]